MPMASTAVAGGGTYADRARGLARRETAAAPAPGRGSAKAAKPDAPVATVPPRGAAKAVAGPALARGTTTGSPGASDPGVGAAARQTTPPRPGPAASQPPSGPVALERRRYDPPVPGRLPTSGGSSAAEPHPRHANPSDGGERCPSGPPHPSNGQRTAGQPPGHATPRGPPHGAKPPPLPGRYGEDTSRGSAGPARPGRHGAGAAPYPHSYAPPSNGAGGVNPFTYNGPHAATNRNSRLHQEFKSLSKEDRQRLVEAEATHTDLLQRTVHVRFLPTIMRQFELAALCRECGEYLRVRICGNSADSQNWIYGFIEFATKAGADKMMQKNGQELFNGPGKAYLRLRCSAAKQPIVDRIFHDADPASGTPCIFGLGNFANRTLKEALDSYFNLKAKEAAQQREQALLQGQPPLDKPARGAGPGASHNSGRGSGPYATGGSSAGPASRPVATAQAAGGGGKAADLVKLSMAALTGVPEDAGGVMAGEPATEGAHKRGSTMNPNAMPFRSTSDDLDRHLGPTSASEDAAWASTRRTAPAPYGLTFSTDPMSPPSRSTADSADPSAMAAGAAVVKRPLSTSSGSDEDGQTCGITPLTLGYASSIYGATGASGSPANTSKTEMMGSGWTPMTLPSAAQLVPDGPASGSGGAATSQWTTPRLPSTSGDVGDGDHAPAAEDPAPTGMVSPLRLSADHAVRCSASGVGLDGPGADTPGERRCGSGQRAVAPTDFVCSGDDHADDRQLEREEGDERALLVFDGLDELNRRASDREARSLGPSTASAAGDAWATGDGGAVGVPRPAHAPGSWCVSGTSSPSCGAAPTNPSSPSRARRAVPYQPPPPQAKTALGHRHTPPAHPPHPPPRYEVATATYRAPDPRQLYRAFDSQYLQSCRSPALSSKSGHTYSYTSTPISGPMAVDEGRRGAHAGSSRGGGHLPLSPVSAHLWPQGGDDSQYGGDYVCYPAHAFGEEGPFHAHPARGLVTGSPPVPPGRRTGYLGATSLGGQDRAHPPLPRSCSAEDPGTGAAAGGASPSLYGQRRGTGRFYLTRAMEMFACAMEYGHSYLCGQSTSFFDVVGSLKTLLDLLSSYVPSEKPNLAAAQRDTEVSPWLAEEAVGAAFGASPEAAEQKLREELELDCMDRNVLQLRLSALLALSLLYASKLERADAAQYIHQIVSLFTSMPATPLVAPVEAGGPTCRDEEERVVGWPTKALGGGEALPPFLAGGSAGDRSESDGMGALNTAAAGWREATPQWLTLDGFGLGGTAADHGHRTGSPPATFSTSPLAEALGKPHRAARSACATLYHRDVSTTLMLLHTLVACGVAFEPLDTKVTFFLFKLAAERAKQALNLSHPLLDALLEAADDGAGKETAISTVGAHLFPPTAAAGSTADPAVAPAEQLLRAFYRWSPESATAHLRCEALRPTDAPSPPRGRDAASISGGEEAATGSHGRFWDTLPPLHCVRMFS